jgi:tetratricopeptide (TPR) repeat protein
MMRARRPEWRALTVAALALASISCHGTEGTVEGSPAEGAAIDPPTMAFLSIARALHHEADIDETRGDTPAAIAVLERLVTTHAPAGAEVEEVLADANARLAELRLKVGDLAGADRSAQAGLEHAREPTYFRGHLLEVSGLVEEARAKGLVDAAKPSEAERARAKAMELLEEAVRIQQQVIDRALGDGGRDG